MTLDPWDAPLGDAPFAFVDLEMTGLDPEAHRVCELAILRTRGSAVERTLETLVWPGEKAGQNANIHGLSAEALAGAPTFADLAADVTACLDGAIVVAHHARYDVLFLEAELARAGRPTTIERVLDTLPIARRCLGLPSHRLTALTEALGIVHDRPHRAGDDARATMELFFRLVAIAEAKTPRDLSHVRVGEKHARPEIVKRAEEARDHGRPVTVRYRPSSRPIQELSLVVTAVRTDIDPPVVLGYLHPGRGRRELRADRILAIHGP